MVYPNHNDTATDGIVVLKFSSVIQHHCIVIFNILLLLFVHIFQISKEQIEIKVENSKAGEMHVIRNGESNWTKQSFYRETAHHHPTILHMQYIYFSPVHDRGHDSQLPPTIWFVCCCRCYYHCRLLHTHEEFNKYHHTHTHTNWNICKQTNFQHVNEFACINLLYTPKKKQVKIRME